MQRQGGFFYWVKIIVILAAVGAGFFCTEKVWAADHLVINEIQMDSINGTGGDKDNWIELYNSTDQAIDLKTENYRIEKTVTALDPSIVIRIGNNSDGSYPGGTIIPAKGFYLIVRDDANDVLKNKADAIGISDNFTWTGTKYTFYLGTGAISSDTDSDIIDKVGFGSAIYYEGSGPALAIPEGKSIERQPTGQDTNNNNADFFIQENPNPQNSITPLDPPLLGGTENPPADQPATPPAPNDTASSTNSTNPPNPPLEGGQKVKLGEVVINELVSDPSDNEVEWIELFNKSAREIDLTGWRLEDGSKAKTSLTGSLGVSGNNLYKIIEKPSGNLNNAGDIIILYDAGEKIIDQVVYGGWDDGNIADNAPVAGDPGSAARKFDGYNTFNNANDFALTIRPTKGAANIIQIEDEASAETKAKFDFSNDIFISEILPNPTGDDTKLEFIEIYNAGQREVNLTGWSLSNKDDKKINLEKIATSTIIKAGEYLAFFRTRTKIVLHNDQGQVKLFQPLADKPVRVVDYKNVKEGWSYNVQTPLTPLLKGGDWTWSETPTPGAINVFKTVNHAPEAEFNMPVQVLIGAPVIFDSSDTADADDDKLKFSWDFGDGFYNSLANPEHTYFKIGIYKVKLAVSDGPATSTKEKSVKVVSSVDEISGLADSPPLNLPLRKGENNSLLPMGVIINEILPNPEGADSGQEWLEIKSQSAEQIDLLNWRVENSNGKYKFANAQLLKAGYFYVLDNVKSKLAFKNTDDVISLYNDLDELADQVEYAGAVQGEAYARGANNKWFWTTKVTPGQENIISLAGSKSVNMVQAPKAVGSANSYIETTLEKVRELEVGSLVKVKGTVAVLPGILGVQIFYIVGLSAQAGSPGIQIYNYKKDFPALKVGDYIEVAGELAQTQGELRIKTKDKNGISLIEHKASPMALAVKGDEVSEETVGQLIAITGEITDKKSTSLYVDDGNGEIFIYIKQSTGIDTKNLAVGQKVSVTGILSKTSTGLRLLPRGQGDIVLINSAGGSELEPQVLGEVAASDEWELAGRNKKLELFKYLLIIAGGIIVLLAGLFIKMKRKN